MDLGLISDSLSILSFFGIGVILAIFYASGKDWISIKVLITWVSGPAMISVTGLMNLVGN